MNDGAVTDEVLVSLCHGSRLERVAVNRAKSVGMIVKFIVSSLCKRGLEQESDRDPRDQSTH